MGLCTGEWSGSLAEVMHNIADAVTQCKFEATDRHSDEVVLYRILQVGWATRPLYTTRDNVNTVLHCPLRLFQSGTKAADAALPGYVDGP